MLLPALGGMACPREKLGAAARHGSGGGEVEAGPASSRKGDDVEEGGKKGVRHRLVRGGCEVEKENDRVGSGGRLAVGRECAGGRRGRFVARGKCGGGGTGDVESGRTAGGGGR